MLIPSGWTSTGPTYGGLKKPVSMPGVHNLNSCLFFFLFVVPTFIVVPK